MHTVSFFSILFIKVVCIDVVVISISLLSFFDYYFLITVSLHFLGSELLITLFIKIIPKRDIIGEIIKKRFGGDWFTSIISSNG